MKQYFKYFRVLYIIFAVLFVITAAIFVVKLLVEKQVLVRGNHECPTERVYDYADVLTAEEEENLRLRIAQTEEKIRCDLVIVTINLSVLEHYGYGENTDYNWESAMMAYADDFYDQNLYGYDRACGDGALLLDNWYLAGTGDSEAGSWLGTCGRVYNTYSSHMIDDLLDEVYYDLDEPYEAYLEYIEHMEYYMSDDGYSVNPTVSVGTCLVLALIPAAIFVGIHLKNKEGTKTTTQNTYVDKENNGSAVFRIQRDDLIDKKVTSIRIDTGSGGGGGGSRSRSGGGGGHRSSGGVRHGGGGRRR